MTSRHRYLERCDTHDAKVPFDDDDPKMEHSWTCIAVPPSDDPGWFVLDSSHHRKTVWARWHDAEGCA